MAHLYRNGTNYHVQLYVRGRRRRFSLKTDNYGIARDKVRKLEAELICGDLERPTQTSVADLAQRFARHLQHQARPGSSSVQTDIYRLREFLGPICPELEGNSRVRRGIQLVHGEKSERNRKKPRPYQFSIRVNFVEEVTTSMVADFLTHFKASDNNPFKLIFASYGWPEVYQKRLRRRRGGRPRRQRLTWVPVTTSW
jgi:hypothetical protein